MNATFQTITPAGWLFVAVLVTVVFIAPVGAFFYQILWRDRGRG